MITFGSICTGGGLADHGAAAAGLTPLWGVEYDPAIAAVAQRNMPDARIITAAAQHVDAAALLHVDVLHASPPCPSFSAANPASGETDGDRAIAAAICRAIEAHRPRVFTLENVRGYVRSASVATIAATLQALDYAMQIEIVNAADHGVPQTRERMILLARAGGWMRGPIALPQPTPWRGWYDALADLLPGLPDSAFAPWQQPRLPAELTDSALFTYNKAEYGDGFRRADEPAFTITTQSARVRAFLVDGQGAGAGSRPGQRVATRRAAHEPAFTICASAWKGMPRAWLQAGRVVALDARCLARLQSIPDSYWLPDHITLAARIVGNAVPPLAYQRISATALAQMG